MWFEEKKHGKKMEKRGNVKSGVFQISSGLYQFLREKVGVLEVFWILITQSENT